MPEYYSVQINEFAERHFIKSFQKKYKTNWEVTLKAIVYQLERIDKFLLTDKAEIIIDGEIQIIKTKFRIASSKESAKTSGHRCIVALHTKTKQIFVLLI